MAHYKIYVYTHVLQLVHLFLRTNIHSERQIFQQWDFKALFANCNLTLEMCVLFGLCALPLCASSMQLTYVQCMVSLCVSTKYYPGSDMMDIMM